MGMLANMKHLYLFRDNSLIASLYHLMAHNIKLNII